MIRRTPVAVRWLAGLLAFYLIAPFIAGLGEFGVADWRGADWWAIGHASLTSMVSATLATTIAALGAIPLGYLLARVPGRAKAVLGYLVQLPLALPPLASGILLMFLFGYSTPIGRATNGMLTDSFAGIILAETFVAAPFAIISARSGFGAVDPALEGVAATLGRRPLEIFLRVSLPLAWPAVRAGLLLTWLRAFGEFGATVLVAYHPYSLPVYTFVAFGSRGLPAMLPPLLPAAALALLFLGVSNRGSLRAEGRVPEPPLVSFGENGPLHRPWPVPRPPSSTGLSVCLRKLLNGFALDLTWSSTARRLAILGPSGSGKSLTLRLLAGIEAADEAKVILGGCDLTSVGAAERAIAYVPQNYGLFPNLTVREQLRFPADADRDLASYWLDRLGLAGLEGRYPAALSLGQQQRVALARALVRPSRLALLDEPFSALDAPLRAELRRALCSLQDEIGATMMVVTHDPEEALLLADELLVLGRGRLLQAGSTEAVSMRPASETVARLLGAVPAGDGIVLAENRIAVDDGIVLTVSGPPLIPGSRVGWSVRPECVRICAAGQYDARIVGLGPIRGGSCEISLRLGGGVLRAWGEGRRYAVGDRCRLAIPPKAIQVWTSTDERRCGPRSTSVEDEPTASAEAATGRASPRSGGVTGTAKWLDAQRGSGSYPPMRQG